MNEELKQYEIIKLKNIRCVISKVIFYKIYFIMIFRRCYFLLNMTIYNYIMMLIINDDDNINLLVKLMYTNAEAVKVLDFWVFYTT